MSLETVGQYLQDEALRRIQDLEKDVFGRSSFNRYYYGAFVESRQLMASLKPEWINLNHSAIPDALRGTVFSDFKRANEIAKRARDSAGRRACSHAMSALKDLADLLEYGYATRVVADYKLETKVRFQGETRYSLNEVEVSLAKQWPSKARGYAGLISNSWRQVNVNLR